jgi:hypothetical protein
MQHYSTAVPQTASDVFDGELVIAHYGSGLYYSISEAGALIWQGLRHGLSDVEVSQWLAAHYTAQAGDIPDLVAGFVAQLLAEGLILASAGPVSAGELAVLTGTTLSTPQLERYEDLQNLLLLDPVHDVDETGWPRRADDGN